MGGSGGRLASLDVAAGLALLLGVGCSCAPEIPVWSCPPRMGEGPTWPRWYTAIHGPAGAAPEGAVIVARHDGRVIGRGIAHDDGSFLLRLQLDEDDGDAELPGARVDLRFRTRTQRYLGDGWVRIPHAAPVTFFNHGESCAGATWALSVRFQPHRDGVPAVREMRAIDMQGPAWDDVDPVPLGAQVARELELETCESPWMLFGRHAPVAEDEEALVSGCWDTCPEASPRCGGCTRAAWAAGLCDLPAPGDAGPTDAGPAPDAGPPTPPD